jgi:hypothetical protein
MSSLPGLHLEDYIAWAFDFVVEDQPDPNFSLSVVEALGSSTGRKHVSKEQFAVLLKDFEHYREEVESWLAAFNSETQSWRMYAENSPVPAVLWLEAQLVAQFMGSAKPNGTKK